MNKGIKDFMVFIITLTILSYGALAFAEKKQHNHITDNILASYFKIRDQLTANSLEGVAAEARSIIRQVSLAEKGTKHSEQERQLMADIGRHVAQIPHREIKDVRKSFAELGRSLIKYIETTANDRKDELFIYYCPMKKEYWIQESKGVSNPFFGGKMLNCGSLVQGEERKSIVHKMEGHNKEHHKMDH